MLSFTIHHRRSNMSKLYICVRCGKTLANRHNLSRHKKTCKGGGINSTSEHSIGTSGASTRNQTSGNLQDKLVDNKAKLDSLKPTDGVDSILMSFRDYVQMDKENNKEVAGVLSDIIALLHKVPKCEVIMKIESRIQLLHIIFEKLSKR